MIFCLIRVVLKNKYVKELLIGIYGGISNVIYRVIAFELYYHKCWAVIAFKHKHKAVGIGLLLIMVISIFVLGYMWITSPM